MDGISYRKCAKICLEEIKSYCETNHKNIANDEIRKMKEGRTGSSVFDQEITLKINEDKLSIIENINKKIEKQGILATINNIHVPSTQGNTRAFYDLSLEGVFLNEKGTEPFDVPINLKFVTGGNSDNVSGGLKLCGYLLSNNSIKEMDDGKFFSSKKKLLSYISDNEERIKNQSTPRDYFVITFYKDKDASFKKISIGSVLDGGISVNGAQGYPGLQLNMKQNIWNESFDYKTVPSITLGWMNQYVMTNEESYTKTKELFQSITNQKEKK